MCNTGTGLLMSIIHIHATRFKLKLNFVTILSIILKVGRLIKHLSMETANLYLCCITKTAVITPASFDWKGPTFLSSK